MNRDESKSLLMTFPPDLLAEVLAEKLAATAKQAPQQSNKQWLNTDPAWQYLGLNSAAQLRRLRSKGMFRHGTEYRLVESEYQFHIERCLERLATEPEKRKPQRTLPRVNRGKKSA